MVHKKSLTGMSVSAAKKAGFFAKGKLSKAKGLRKQRGREKADVIKRIRESNLPEEKKKMEIEQVRGKSFFSRFRRKKKTSGRKYAYGGFESAGY